jgi:Asp-tRNA(Asn)/Glu-tRNA(Gln) amidotransferase A subunit family amidase
VPVRFTPSAQALAVASGELDPEKLLVATLERIEERNVSLCAVAATFPRESRAMLARAPRGPLYGVPVTMKDMYSLPWRGYRNGTVRELGRPAASGAFRRLRDAGAVVVGIDNQHELGLGSTGLVSAYAVSAKGGPPAAPGPEADHLCYLDDVWS